MLDIFGSQYSLAFLGRKEGGGQTQEDEEKRTGYHVNQLS